MAALPKSLAPPLSAPFASSPPAPKETTLSAPRPKSPIPDQILPSLKLETALPMSHTSGIHEYQESLSQPPFLMA